MEGVEESEGEGEGDGDGKRRRRRGEAASAASGDGARRPGRVSEPSHRSSGVRSAIAAGDPARRRRAERGEESAARTRASCRRGWIGRAD